MTTDAAIIMLVVRCAIIGVMLVGLVILFAVCFAGAARYIDQH